MRFLLLVWLVIEVLQLVLIGMLMVGYRNLQRRMDEGAYRFGTHPPPSVTRSNRPQTPATHQYCGPMEPTLT